MNKVTVNETKNSVIVNETTNTVTVNKGESFSTTGTNLNDFNKVNNSVVYFDQPSGTFKADATRTVENLVDGGNF